MSHFATYKANVSNETFLIEALKEMGFAVEKNKTIRDYYRQNAQVDIAVVGKPIGFKWNADEKKYDVIADWWGTGTREKEFCNKVSQLHEKYKVENICRSKGLRHGAWKLLEDGSLQLEAEQYVY